MGCPPEKVSLGRQLTVKIRPARAAAGLFRGRSYNGTPALCIGGSSVALGCCSPESLAQHPSLVCITQRLIGSFISDIGISKCHLFSGV